MKEIEYFEIVEVLSKMKNHCATKKQIAFMLECKPSDIARAHKKGYVAEEPYIINPIIVGNWGYCLFVERDINKISLKEKKTLLKEIEKIQKESRETMKEDNQDIKFFNLLKIKLIAAIEYEKKKV